jgi:hypothetical protein
MTVSAHADARAQMRGHQVDLFIPLVQRGCRLATDHLQVQDMGQALSFQLWQAGNAGLGDELVHRNGIDDIGGNPGLAGQVMS